jgi:formylglycine-generating enzyme required for sulfatase activity
VKGARRLYFRVAFVAATAAIVACQALAGIDDLVIGDCKGGVCGPDGSTDVASFTDSPIQPPVDGGAPCLGKDPQAVRVGSPGNTFCIDKTEVTIAQYKVFQQAAVDPATQPEFCRWNTSFAPALPPPVDGGPAPPAADEPVGWVDFCDAYAYCAWAGEYLCGKVENGKKTGPVTVDGLPDYRSHQWMLACSAEARLKYPYGNIFDGAKCNIADYDAGRAVPVASATECVGGYAGLSDMIGNVWEWYDGPCAPGSLEVDGGDGGPHSDGCSIKGGSYGDRGGNLDCRFDGTIRRDLVLANVGFRCCSN